MLWMQAIVTGALVGAAAMSAAQEPPAAKQAEQPGGARSSDKKPAGTNTPAPKTGDQKKAPPPPTGKSADGKTPPDATGKTDKQDAKKDKSDDETPDADKFKDVEVARPTLFELGYGDWGQSGSRNKFLQYATPPRSYFLREFRLRPLHAPPGTDLLFNVKSIGQPDYIGEASLGFWYGNTRLSGSLARNRFFDPTPSLIPSSERRVDRAIIRQQLWKDFSLSYGYRNDDLNKSYQEPQQPVFLNSRYRELIAGGKFGNGYANLKFWEWDFVSHPGADRKDVLDKTTTRALNASYFWTPARAIGLEGAYTRTWIYQPNINTARLDTLSLDGDIAVGPTTTLDFVLRQQHAQIPIIQNAFVRDQRVGALRVAQRFHGWTAQAGFRVQEAERVRGDHTFVDVPRWTTFDGKLTGRMFHIARVTLRGSTQALEHAPISVTTDTRSLYWSGRDTAQLKIDLAPSPYVTGYAQWGYHHWRNAARSTTLTNHNVTFGGDWQATPVLDFFGEFTRDIWGGRGENLDYPTLNNFVPDSQVSALGANWAFSPRATLSITYSEFGTISNDNPLLLREGNTYGAFLTVNAHYQFPRGYELGFIFAPWTFRDKVVPTQDYDAALLLITGAARF